MLLDRVVRGLAQPGGVREQHGQTAELQCHLNHITRRARNRRDNGCGPLCQRVEQRRFARVGRAKDGDAHALAHDLTAPAVGKLALHLTPEHAHLRHRAAQSIGRDIVRVLAEVYERLRVRERAEQLLSPPLELGALRTAHVAQRLLPLLLRVRVDEVCQPLYLRQLHPTVCKCLARELTRLCHAQALEPPERLERRCDHGARAVRVQLDGVLSGERIGRWKPQGEDLVNQAAALAIIIFRSPQLAQHGLPWLGRLAISTRRHAPENLPRLRTRHSHHRHACAACARGEREYGVSNGRRGRKGFGYPRVSGARICRTAVHGNGCASEQ